MTDPTPTTPPTGNAARGGFRRAVLRGLGVVLPPLLTIVVLIWAWNTIESYVLGPIESGVRSLVVYSIEDTLSEAPANSTAITDRRMDGFRFGGTTYVPDTTGRRFFPEYVKNTVDENADRFNVALPPPATARAYWHRYVQLRYLPRTIVVPIFLVAFAGVLYFLGRLFTFGIGSYLLHAFDAAILRIPIVNKVYGGVKQVTDFAFNERDIQVNNVVAVQYPRDGLWSLGFVTGSSLKQLTDHTGEEMLSVLMPTSPMPMTGFTITVRRSETIDMDMTLDEAIQFVVSGGVVVPPGQRMHSTDPKPRPLPGSGVTPAATTAATSSS